MRTPAQSAARLRAVTREQVRALLARFSFSVAYLVTSPEGGPTMRDLTQVLQSAAACESKVLPSGLTLLVKPMPAIAGPM